MESLQPTATILNFSPRRTTCVCGYRFIPLRPEHRYCRTCYRWGRIGQLLDATTQTFASLREGWR